MDANAVPKQKLALVLGNLPTVDEVDQFKLLSDKFDVSVVSTQSICGYLNETSRFNHLRCLALPDHEENPTYMPGLEQVLAEFDIVVLKERLGLYAIQTVKAKWKNRFRLAVWVDNLAAYPAEDVAQMRTVREEVGNAADVYLVQSKAAKNTLILEGVSEARIEQFSPWVERYPARTKKSRAAALKDLGLPEGSLVIAHVGQVEWEEGLVDLATGCKFAMLKDKSLERRLRLVFCGIGSFSPQLRETLVALGIDDRAVFVAPSREAFARVLTAADCVYLASTPSRDRIEGEPYRIMTAMANEIPILANRSPLIEEYCGKHRIDFCFGSPESVATAIAKAVAVGSLRNDVVKKNAHTVKSKFSEAKVGQQMVALFNKIGSRAAEQDVSSVDHRVLEIETLVSSKQYLKAIDAIETVFKGADVATHHRSNLYRLIGDCFAKLGDNEGAKNAYIKSIEIDPYAAKAYIGLGTVSLVKQSPDIAVLHFQKAVSLAPEDEMANLGLGLAFQGMDELDEANNWVVKALEKNAENTAALYTLVKIAYDREKFVDAKTALERYTNRHPHDHNMLFTLCGVLFKLEEFQTVVELTQRIISTDPMDARAHALHQQALRVVQTQMSSNA